VALESPAGAIELAGRLADAAGEVIRPHFRTGIAIADKADASPVTIADRGAEEVMRRLIGEAFPAHGIEGEEFGLDRAEAPWRWILDPIDGTKSFVSGSPMFGTLIALTNAARPSLGVIDQPVLRERWLAHGGAPTTLNGRPVRVRACERLERAVVYTSTPDIWGRARWDTLARLIAGSRFVRSCGDCYAYGLLACGEVDLVLETGLKPHDFAALVPIVENAGGIASDWQGRPLPLDRPADFLACGDARVHAQAIALLNG